MKRRRPLVGPQPAAEREDRDQESGFSWVALMGSTFFT